MPITISNYIRHFTISGPYPNMLWWRDGRKNHHRFKFRYAISIISLFQEQARYPHF